MREYEKVRQLAINELPVHDTHLRLDRDRVFGKFVVAFQLLGRLIVASYLRDCFKIISPIFSVRYEFYWLEL